MIVRYLAFEAPGGPFEFFMVYITLVLAITAGMMVGLFASVLSPNSNSAPLFVILLILPQMVLNGALIPLPQYISAPTINYWAFKALMGISGAGSDVAGDACWSLPEDQWSDWTLDDKADNNCPCMGISVLDGESCIFPGIGEYYDPAIEQSAPIPPHILGDPPPEPVLPERPVEPEDQSDTTAMFEFLNEFKAWETEAQEIQADYMSRVDAYQAEADLYKTETVSYQESLAEWNIARTSAVVRAENTIKEFNDIIGWSFMNKDDAPSFRTKIAQTWLAMIVIISIFIAGIFIIQKRKDSR